MSSTSTKSPRSCQARSADALVERFVVMPDGTIAHLWWPTCVPIPPGYTVELVEDADSAVTRVHDFKLVPLQ
jgi:hypothetical protein